MSAFDGGNQTSLEVDVDHNIAKFPLTVPNPRCGVKYIFKIKYTRTPFGDTTVFRNLEVGEKLQLFYFFKFHKSKSSFQFTFTSRLDWVEENACQNIFIVRW